MESEQYEALFLTLRNGALRRNELYSNDELLKLAKTIDGYEDPRMLVIGSDPLLSERARIVFIEGQNKGVIAQSNPGRHPGVIGYYDLFDFRLNPFGFLAHYSNWVEGTTQKKRFNGEMGIAPPLVDGFRPLDAVMEIAMTASLS